ncbi:tumor necrosis factor receptor superfamily member 11B-like [Polypterus senegalus]|uniref:tumor necrosis factor receptor superfamily member 11B-like n=1 Tax=Polypterus senegalus TaxID=55291 RepID=UPI00196637D9|nr:tumor necrosis factor receptor superfamily member 11B-like [Polypterus senegalus]
MLKAKLQILLALFLEADALLEWPGQYTYQREDPASGQMLTCDRCPPGEYLVQHCTATHKSQCAPCPEKHYTQYWNYISKCQYCNVFCKENQHVKEECNRFQNRVCECDEGYYWDHEFCIKHMVCPPGYGVKHKGTPHTNTVCEKCPPGYFSSVSSSQEACEKHTDCKSQLQILNGTTWHDNLCISCENLRSTGVLSQYEDILSEFLARQNLDHKKLVKLGRTLLKEQGENVVYREQQHDSPKELIRSYVKNWSALQTAHRLIPDELISKLEEANLHAVARRLKRKFLKIRLDETLKLSYCLNAGTDRN